jgi:uncharacterized protein (TIGR00369 family)
MKLLAKSPKSREIARMTKFLSTADLPATLDSFEKWQGEEPFEDHAGPFYMRIDSINGVHLSAFMPETRHMNGGNALHGGMLMAFADYALFVIARDATNGQPCVTVSCHTDFVRGARPSEPVFAAGEVTRDSRSLIFVRGEIFTKTSGVLASFNGILKRIGVH